MPAEGPSVRSPVSVPLPIGSPIEKPQRGLGRYYLVFLISLVTASQITDRQVLSIVIEPVKHEFGLNDAQMGFLNGTVFGVAYAIGALPLAALADRWSRKKVIAATLACWSFFTAATMSASNYASLAIARFLVGLGEAGAGPASLAMIASRFSPERRSGIIAVLTAVSAVSAFAAFWGAGFVVEHFGWRRMFLIFGGPGLILAALFWVTVKEQPLAPSTERQTLTIAELMRVLGHPQMLHVFATCVWNAIIANGTGSWTPSFFVRTFGMTMSKVGFWLGLAGVMSGLVGALLGGFIADALNRRNPLGGICLSLCVIGVYLPLNLGTYLVGSEPIALALMLAGSLMVGMSSAPIAAQFLNFMPQKSMATAMAILSMAILLISSLGPALVGIFSDFATTHGAKNGLRDALLAVAAMGILPILHLGALLARHGDTRAIMKRPARSREA